MEYLEILLNDYIQREVKRKMTKRTIKTYEKHLNRFVAYIRIAAPEKIEGTCFIDKMDIEDSVEYYHKKGSIKSVNSLDNYLRVLNAFFIYLGEQGKGDNIFSGINYETFTRDLAERFSLVPAKQRIALADDEISKLLQFLNKNMSEHRAIAFFCKLTLLAPAARAVIGDLRIKDFYDCYGKVEVNGERISIPRALQIELFEALEPFRNESGEDRIFELLYGADKFNYEKFNTDLYYILKKSGCHVPPGKGSASADSLRNAAILNLLLNGAYIFYVAKVAGLSLQSIGKKIESYDLDTQKRIIELQKGIDGANFMSPYYKYI